MTGGDIVAPATGRGRRARAVRISRSLSDRLEPGSRAEVIGVYSGATHLRLGSGALLVVVAPAVALSPNGMAVEAGRDRTGPGEFRVGQTVDLGPSDADAPAADWRVALGGAATWEPRPCLAAIPRPVLADRLRLARATVVADGARGGLLPLLWIADGGASAVQTGVGPLAGPPAWRLAEAAVRGDAGSVAAAARRLAGLGPGLTPSGDDFLAGFGAAWTLVGQSAGLGRAARLRVTEALVAGGEAGASPLGLAWIEHAVRGELAEPMTRFVDALGAAGPRDLAPATRGVLAVGAASGTDWMVGFLLGATGVVEATRWDPSSC